MVVGNRKDFWSGILFALLGVFFIVFAQEHELGQASRMGPAYFPTVLGILLAAIGLIVALGLIMGAVNNPKSLIKTGLVIVGAAAVVALAFLTAKGNPAQGFVGQQPEFTTLRNTDAILTITYLVFGASIVAIVIGMIVNAIRSK